MEEIDIWRVAKLLIDHHGNDARREADKRINAFLEASDIDGHRVWLRVLAAIKELQNLAPLSARVY